MTILYNLTLCDCYDQALERKILLEPVLGDMVRDVSNCIIRADCCSKF